jgi:methylenetetrahydrofolate--tRNA-(uracil-5-)-methyltransferase
MIGALCQYITHASMADFQPMKANFDLIQPIDGFSRGTRHDRNMADHERSMRDLADIGFDQQ